MNTDQVVNLEERARIAILLGESHFREFKSALHGTADQKVPRQRKSICRDVGETLVAFANADGGELLIGVEDDGTITGLDALSEPDVNTIRGAPKTHVHNDTPLPSMRTATLKLDGGSVLYFSIAKSTSHIHLTADGRCVQRRDLETVPVPAEHILFSRQERTSREYDREYIDGATPADLSPELVRTVADHVSRGMSVEKCLQHLDLAEYIGPGLRLRRAALLLFAREPNQWHPRLQVRIIKIAGTELKSGAEYNAKSDQLITGNVLEIVDRAWEALRPHLVQTKLGREARFETTIMYPELACREALVNAIAHRDYSEEGRGIEIFVFDDRMEVRNPGALLSSISIEDLERLDGVHQSRNASTARVLREVGYMRELGEGMRRMFDLMRQNELTPPELVTDSSSFCVRLRHSTIYTDAQSLWLDQFIAFDLNREQKAIVVLGLGGNLVAPQDIWDSLGIVDTEHYRQLIDSLQKIGLIRSAIPKVKAKRIADQKRIPVRKVARFKIGISSGVAEAATQRRPAREVFAESEDLRNDVPNVDAQIWLSNLPYDLDEGGLLRFLGKFGNVENLTVPKEAGTRCRGYAFLEFESVDVSRAALEKLRGSWFAGRRVVAHWSKPRRRT